MPEDTGVTAEEHEAHDDDLAEAEALGDRAVITKPISLELPDFEGREVIGQVVKINGTTSRVTRPIHIGDEVFALVRLEGKEVNHKRTDDGIKRHATLQCDDFYELTEQEGRNLLARKRAEAVAAGEVEGQLTLDDVDPGDEVMTDASGVVLTDAERAAITEVLGELEERVAKGLPPIAGYAGMSASEAITAIAACDDLATIEATLEYEKRTLGRTSVIEAATLRSDALYERTTEPV